MPTRGWSAACAALLLMLLVTACVRPTAPGPVVIRNSPPPWEPPRDAVAYIEAAGLPAQPLNATGNVHIVAMTIVVDGFRVAIPAYIGMDRRRAQQAPVHTHDNSNRVSLEGPGAETVTLGQFFSVWAVRFDNRCLGAACAEVTVTADGEPVTEPRGLVLSEVDQVTVYARS